MKKLFLSFLPLLFLFPFFAQFIIAKADDLVIQDDGKVVLVITNNNGVLGETTATIKEPVKPTASAHEPNPPQQNQNKPQSAPPSPSSHPALQAETKTVPLVPPHTQSTVQINPPINNDKKVQVTITTGATTQTSQSVTNQTAKTPPAATAVASGTAAGNSPTIISPKSTSTPPTNTLTKTVDQVVAQGKNGQPVLTIKSGQAGQLTIQQSAVQATTSLPLQIDTLTHSLSVPSEKESVKVSVLPAEAMQGIIDKGLLNTQSVKQAKISLTKDTTGIGYTVQSEKQGKLFGIFNVKSPVQVKLSAQNGKVVNVSQPILFNLFGGLIK